jgi:hypothetical protein
LKRQQLVIASILVLASMVSIALAQTQKTMVADPLKKASRSRPVPAVPAPPRPVPKRFPVPAQVRGIYSTSWIAGSGRMEELIGFVKRTQVNTMVIDLKDDTGMVSYPTNVPLAKAIGAPSNRIRGLRELIARLRNENVYVIARIVVFKDPLLARKHPEIAVLDKNGGLWKDRKGMIWVDPHSRLVWKYNLDLAKEAVAIGFNEVQFDYVRFLSDGKISNCVYPFSKGERKEDVIRDFLQYARKDLNALGVPLSADIFGLVLSVPNDLNIGQKLEKIAESVDYISPMVYPSHYPKGSFGIAEPNLHPYEIVNRAMQDALKRIPGGQGKLRPWLQDFNLGHTYGPEELQLQIKALQDNGIHDWLFWNPSNRYDRNKYN